jgi:hypothetical protein
LVCFHIQEKFLTTVIILTMIVKEIQLFDYLVG